MSPWAIFPPREPPCQVRAFAEQIEQDGGHVLAVYQKPLGDHWQVFCLLPLGRVEPTPFQRRLSPAHARRLQEVVRKLDRFIDPIVVVSPSPGVYWTPNGNHRRAAMERLQGELIPAIAIPDQRFDATSVRYADVARSALMAGPPGGT
ncbi:MAG: ParB N-terminal domain-containing protein [Armatimonadota bacterium]|nr:ParB N-terminal domain-containing protein [Armatimonadota bacterium]